MKKSKLVPKAALSRKETVKQTTYESVSISKGWNRAHTVHHNKAVPIIRHEKQD